MALGREAKRRGKQRAPKDPRDAAPAPTVSVLAPAGLEQESTTTPAAGPPTDSQALVVGVHFFLWYILNIGYNITNKKSLNAIALPWSISALQLAVGSTFVIPLWMLRLRSAPGLTMANIKDLSPIAVCHMLSHVCATIGLGAGSTSFVHVIKATEPLLTALISAVFLKQTFSPLVYLTLVPVVAGVGLTARLTALKDFEFNWPAFIAAVGCTLANSTRAILSKRAMGKDVGKNMTPGNTYAVLTMMATSMLLPLSAIVEGPEIQDRWDATVTSTEKLDEIVYNVVASGVFFYLFNEVAFRCLGRVHPVTHAVGSAFKRVFFIATSIIVFKSKLTPLVAVGSYLAVTGVQLYRLAGE